MGAENGPEFLRSNVCGGYVIELFAWCLSQLEKTNQTKVGRLIDHLVGLKSPANAFALFCENVGKWCKWLVRDLVADLKVERGDVKPRPETVEEAAALVHR
jgi:hypothetical protein